MVLLVVGLMGIRPRAGLTAAAGYVFTPLAFLGAPGDFINDFEPNGLNNNGEVLFGADVSTGEGIFVLSKGSLLRLARSGDPAPGGSTFDVAFLGPASLNDDGDVAFDFILSPFSLPVGVNSGAYSFSHSTKTLRPVVVPGVTPAPGGGSFVGVVFGPTLNNRGDIVFPGIVRTNQGIHLSDEPYIGLGVGLFSADNHGVISRVVTTGDPAPGGGVFDWTYNPWIND